MSKWSALAIAGVFALSACGEKGPRGDEGPQGPAGPVGGVYAAPVIDGVFLPLVTYDAVLLITGSGFDTTPENNEVWVGEYKAEVLDGDANNLIVTHAVENNLDSGPLGPMFTRTHLLHVVSHNLVSNPIEVEQIPPGMSFGLGSPNVDSPTAMTTAANGDLVIVDNGLGAVVRMTAAGVLQYAAFHNDPVGGSAMRKAWSRADGIWVLTTSNRLMRYGAEGLEYVAVFGVDAIDGEWDAAGNFFALGSTGLIERWDAATRTLSTFDQVNASTSTSAITRIAGDLYVADNTNTRVARIPIADPAMEATFSTSAISNMGAMTTDGTNLFVYSNATGTIRKVDNAGAVTDLTTLGIGGAPAGLATDANGRVYASASSSIVARIAADGLSVNTWVSPAGSNGFAVIGDRTFVGGQQSACTGDLPGDVLWEINADGDLRRVGDGFCTTEQVAVSGGQILFYNVDTGNLERMNVDTGAVTTFFDDSADAIADVNGLAVDGAGNVYAGTIDTATGDAVIAKFTSAGILSAVDFITFTNDPSGIALSLAVQGTRLVANTSSGYLMQAPTATGGDLTHINQAVLVIATDLTITPDGEVLIPDIVTNSLFSLAANDDIWNVYDESVTGRHWVLDDSGYYFGFDGFSYAVVLP